MGAVSKWPALYAANKAVVGSDPNLILPGQKLTIPGGNGDKPVTNPPDTKPVDDNFTSAILRLTNAERAKAGLKPLQLGPLLTGCAQDWADHMAATGVMEHGDVGPRIKACGVNWRSYGENIAEGYKTPEAVMTGWMNSPGHKANILTPGFEYLGVGLTTDSHGRSWWVQDFVSLPVSAPVTVAKGYTSPVSSPVVTQAYGNPGANYTLGYHTGVDLLAPMGTKVYAVSNGTIVASDTSSAYGTNVQMKNADGTYSLYAHLSSKLVSAGATVKVGQLIGYSGNSGTSTGPHLHFEIRTQPAFAAGNFINPVSWLKSHGVTI